MDRAITPHATAERPIPAPSAGLMKAAALVRYRFFLYAGLLPYLLGAAWAYGMEGEFNARLFWIGFLGIFLSVVGVESFNEYFDARMGTDRVFNPSDEAPIPEWTFWLGVLAFAVAGAIGFYLARDRGPSVIFYMTLGGLAAVFYVGPPFRWVYHGLGELAISLSYGPWMTLGSLALHTNRFSYGAFMASLVPGLLIAGLAVVNEIPDYHQDRLVGKRNLVVRLGRQGGVRLYLSLASAGLVAALAGAASGLFPKASALAAFAGLPPLIASARAARDTYETPKLFIPAIKWIVLCYIAGTGALILSLLWGQ